LVEFLHELLALWEVVVTERPVIDSEAVRVEGDLAVLLAFFIFRLLLPALLGLIEQALDIFRVLDG